MKKRLFIVYLLLSAMAWQRCENEEEPGPVDCMTNPVELSLVSTEDSNCNATDGSLEVRASGGSGSYRYKLVGGSEQNSGVFSNLGAGVYEITAVDANNCADTLEVSVQNANGMNISFDTQPSGCNGSDGTLSVTASDGTSPYQFKLNGGQATTTSTFSGLQSGEHELVVTDAAGCEVSQSVRVTSGVSFQASISPIISNDCAVSGCHNGSQAPDLRTFKNIQDNASRIKTVTGNGRMPMGGTLTQNEIDMIACWVDDGAPDN